MQHASKSFLGNDTFLIGESLHQCKIFSLYKPRELKPGNSQDKLKDRCRLYEAVKEMQAVDEEAHNEDTSVYQKEISDAEAVLSPLKIRITKGKSARKQLQAEQQREEEKFEQLWKALYSC